VSQTAFTGFPDDALLFYEGLTADNSKAYWNAHRDVYEQCVRAPMLALLEALEPEFGTAKFFRPYRDVRFSRDKTPYKTAAASAVRGLYLQLSSDGLLVAGGLYHAAADEVGRFREALVRPSSGEALERILAELTAAGFRIHGEQLKRRPPGYGEDAPRQDLLRYKDLHAGREFPPEPWLHEPECLDRIQQAWRALLPLRDWLDRHVGGSRPPDGG
jgi:uncharacterized protein (TIGR02453 family)